MAVRFCGCKGALDIRRQDLVRIITTSGSRRQRSSPRSLGTATRLDLVDHVQLLCQADPGEPDQNVANRPMANVSLCDWRDRITEEDEDS
ncbi:hypothetical protein ALC57_07425 [Trachymyrmex cornetzi]|uniref:Uncharacterized protein n=1 Tax=Trachymyrmex cornetzi TaxID=471704 RepID=A0A195E4M4_9HYME|nr:hypothetical protein ALC57_07425 [Trachymyrmex cornetzi]